MHYIPKIQLSPLEKDLVINTEWILAKHEVVKKVYEIFGALQPIFKQEISQHRYLFEGNILQSAKITKGENYQQLPYVILDYPAIWKEDILAVRTMFWWGNFFSITLQLSGENKKRFTVNTQEGLRFLQTNNFFICVNEDEWQHHYNADNYITATSISNAALQKIKAKEFFKISKKISLEEWENAPEFIVNSFREIMDFLQINYQDGKKDLLPVFPKAGSGL